MAAAAAAEGEGWPRCLCLHPEEAGAVDPHTKAVHRAANTVTAAPAT